MGVYIKGMEMPSGCTDCSFSYQSMYCKAMPSHFCGSPEWEVDGVKPDWCPLTEVKEPHGELIDKDKVIDAIFRKLSVKSKENLLPSEKAIFSKVVKAETVIERSEND